jgi:hypothetical protein
MRLTSEYFESIDAPSKELFVIEDAGHFALVTRQAEFLATLPEADGQVDFRSDWHFGYDSLVGRHVPG